MLRLTMLAAILVLSLQSTLTGDDAVQSEWAKLNGAWQLVSYVYDGKEATAKDIADYRMELDTGKLTAWLGDFRDYPLKTASKTIDPSAQPKTMLETQTDKRQVKSLYKLAGDTLTICSALPGAERPTQFASAKGSQHALWKFERIDPLQAPLIMPGPKPLVYRSEKSGITLYVERDAQHVTAIDPDGKILWHKHLTKGWIPDWYPATFEMKISDIGKPDNETVRGVNKVLGLPAETEYAALGMYRHWGLLNIRTAAYFHLGND